ncbi:MAG: DUF1190 domain-containing protein [Bosea sp. (in: a-proteobacteria)]
MSAAPASAQGIAYANRAACEQADKLTSEQCGFAFANARAEFEEKAPRYRGRADCVRAHKACSAQLAGIGGMAGAGREAAIYVPRFEGVSITERNGQPSGVMPKAGAAASRFKARPLDRADDKVDGRIAVVPDSSARRSSGRRYGNDPQSSGPYVRRGERDDTIKMDLPVRDPRDPNATGLFVDKEGVEWYRPARRR